MALNEQPSNPVPDGPVDRTDATPAEPSPQELSPQQLLDAARRAIALKQYESAADQLATVLERLRDSHGEDHEALAPILHLYGRALLESAIANSGALGGGGNKDAPMPSKARAAVATAAGVAAGAAAGPSTGASASGSSKHKLHNDPRFSFSGDAESEDEDEAQDAHPAAEADEEEEEDDDDLGVAFTVLDLARVIYQRALDNAETKQITTLEGQTWDELKVKAELAEVLNDLGDVGLESENFQQASSDYLACLTLLTPLLHPHSRRLADAHLRLGLALEFHPTVSEREGAIRHVKAASAVLATRLAALTERQTALASLPAPASDANGTLPTATDPRAEPTLGETTSSTPPAPASTAPDEATPTAKPSAHDSASLPAASSGKLEKDDILTMTADQVALEHHDVREMKAELDTKLDEYESPDGVAKLSGSAADGPAGLAAEGGGAAVTAKEALERAIAEAFLGASAGEGPAVGRTGNGPVNDLSGMVKRKKKVVEEVVEGKGKGVEGQGKGKKARVEDV